jgi:hypothetical protein
MTGRRAACEREFAMTIEYMIEYIKRQIACMLFRSTTQARFLERLSAGTEQAATKSGGHDDANAVY